MSASLVGSEMCIRDRPSQLASTVSPSGLATSSRLVTSTGTPPWLLRSKAGLSAGGCLPWVRTGRRAEACRTALRPNWTGP
eukprot:14615316-Alexandrium_andersonii.AAC.1